MEDAEEATFMSAAKRATQPDFPVASSEVKLQLYGLFKQATRGPPTSLKRPGTLDPVGRAKYDAWAACDDLGKSEAKLKYIALVKENDPSFMISPEEQRRPPANEQLNAAPSYRPQAAPASSLQRSAAAVNTSSTSGVATTHVNSDLRAAVQSGVVVVDLDVPKYTDLEDDQGFRYTIYNIRVGLSDGKIWTVGRRYTEVKKKKTHSKCLPRRLFSRSLIAPSKTLICVIAFGVCPVG